MKLRPTLVPTSRAVLLIAALALVAIVIAASAPGAWVIAPLFGAAVLVLVIGDALLALARPELEASARRDVEVGADEAIGLTAPLSARLARDVAVSLEADPRLLPGGRADVALKRDDAGWRALLPFAATRRGTAALSRAWLRWTGPLGLGAWQKELPLDGRVRVWPNVVAVRSPALQAFLRDAQFGLIARRIRGEGAEFEALTEYQPGMDRRRIDWKASARHVHLYAKEYEAERNNQIVFAFDCGQAMCEPVAGMARLDRAISAALATAYVALKGGDRVALFGFGARPESVTPFVTDPRDFRRLQQAAAGLEYRAEEPNFTLALATLAGRLQRRSMIVVFSDFTDPTSAELMIESVARLVRRHLVLFVTLADEELDSIAQGPPTDLQALTMAVGADALLKQRALVQSRLRQLGVEVIEAPYDRFGTRVIDAYLAIKRKGDRLMALFGLIGGKDAAQDAAIEAAALRSDRFRQAREADWQRLEGIVRRIEAGRFRKVSDADLLALPVLYRTVASSLAVARETSLDAATLAYLEGLVQRAWFIVYGPRVSLGRWLLRFFGGGWGRAVRELRLEIAVVLALMVAGVFVGWLLCAHDAEWYHALMPEAFAGERVPGASRDVLRSSLFGHTKEAGMSAFAAMLFGNNAQVAILAFALGFAFGIPTLLLVIQNLATMGALLWLYHGQGLTLDLAGWLMVHGTTELYAILLAGAAGLHIGRAIAFPGQRSVLSAAAQAGQRASLVMTGVVLMLVVAALLEGFARQLLDDTPSRMIVGSFMLVLWTAYFVLFRRRSAAAEAGG